MGVLLQDPDPAVLSLTLGSCFHPGLSHIFSQSSSQGNQLVPVCQGLS